MTVTDKQIQARLAQIKKQYFGGNEKKYQAAAQAAGPDEQQVRVGPAGQTCSRADLQRR